MIGDRGPRQLARRVIRAATLNRATRLGESLARGRTGGHQAVVDGIPLSLSAGAATFALVRTTGTITARSGVTPGTGPAALVLWNGTALSSGRTITLRNVGGKPGSSGKYGFAVLLFGTWWIISIEC